MLKQAKSLKNNYWAVVPKVQDYQLLWCPCTVELLWTVWQLWPPPSSPPRPCLPPAHPLNTLAQNWCTPSKKQPEMA